MGGSLGLLIGMFLGTAGTVAAGGAAKGMSVHIPYLALIGMFAATLAVGLLASLRRRARSLGAAGHGTRRGLITCRRFESTPLSENSFLIPHTELT